MSTKAPFISPALLRQYTPKLIETLREGYDATKFGKDIIAGLTVAIVALPLAMALAIASGAAPDKGLVTAVIAGFIISAFGGSRFQIGGPTGAFVVVVFNVIATHGYDGLLQATLMAGIMLLIAGIARFGAVIKYMPQPVVTGFTSGIALIIFSSQIKDFFGLVIAKTPADFIPKWLAYIENAASFSPATLAIGVGSFAIILLMRRLVPKLPAFLFAVIAASLAASLFHLPIDTIGSRFGDLPNMLPMPSFPHFDIARIRELFPSAFTIAFLAGIESLLSAVVADGLTGRHHRSNCELVAQGLANIASVMFGGLPATGAIARTATNIRSGAASPIAGILHAVFLLAFMFFLAPLARYVPLASLAAVLMMVAWNMSEVEHFTQLLRGPRGDGAVLLLTFGLTALVDLTAAIEVGMVTASLLFMYRMSNIVEIQSDRRSGKGGATHFNRRSRDGKDMRHNLPKDVEVFRFRGPFFFGVVSRLVDTIEGVEGKPRLYILDMTDVPLINSSGAAAIGGLIEHCRKRNIDVAIAGLNPTPRATVEHMGIIKKSHNHVKLYDSFSEAIKAAKV